MQRAWIWIRSFCIAWASFYLPFERSFHNVLAYAVTFLGWVIGSEITEKAFVAKFDWTEDATSCFRVNYVSAIAIAGVVFYCALGIGFGIARAYRAKIVLDDSLEVDAKNRAIRFGVRVEGFGEVEAVATIVEIKDHEGNRVYHAETRGVKLEWTHHPGESNRKLTRHDQDVSVTLITWPNVVSAIVHGVVHRQSLTLNWSLNTTFFYWIKVRVYGANCGEATKWYFIRGVPGHWEVTQKDEPLPIFCN